MKKKFCLLGLIVCFSLNLGCGKNEEVIQGETIPEEAVEEEEKTEVENIRKKDNVDKRREEQAQKINIDKNIIGDIIQAVYLSEGEGNNINPWESDEARRMFLLTYQYGGHLEEVLSQYRVDEYYLRMSEDEVNHILDMALGTKFDDSFSNIIDGAYMKQVDNEFLLVQGDIGDNGYKTKIDNVNQEGENVTVTGTIYIYECEELVNYEYYESTFRVNSESVFSGLTMTGFQVKEPDSMQEKLYKFLIITYPDEIVSVSGLQREEIVEESNFSFIDVNHDGIDEVLIEPAGVSHADGYIHLYAYINEKWEELPVQSDELYVFGSGNIYATMGLHQGYDVSYIAFDGNDYKCIMNKYYVGYEEERLEDNYVIDGEEVTKEQAMAYETQIIENISEKSYIEFGEEFEYAIYAPNITWEQKEFSGEWCDLKPENVKEYISKYM